MTMTKNLGMLLLAIYLIVSGAIAVLGLALPTWPSSSAGWRLRRGSAFCSDARTTVVYVHRF